MPMIVPNALPRTKGQRYLTSSLPMPLKTLPIFSVTITGIVLISVT